MTKRNGRANGGSYDPAKDAIVHTFWKKKTGDNQGVRLVLRQYDGGAIKLAYEKVWRDAKSGEIRSKVERCPASVLVEAGICDGNGQIVTAAAVQPARKSEPPPEAAFEL